jgi:hypothetical protein
MMQGSMNGMKRPGSLGALDTLGMMKTGAPTVEEQLIDANKKKKKPLDQVDPLAPASSMLLGA